MSDLVTTQLRALTAPGTSQPVRAPNGSHVLTATVTGIGAVAAALTWEGSNDLQGWVSLGTLGASGTEVASASANTALDYAYWRVSLASLTGALCGFTVVTAPSAAEATAPVSGAGNVAVLNARAASTVAPLMLDDYQDHTLYTGANGTLSTVASPFSGAGRVALASPADSQTAMTVSRTIPYEVNPSKLGRIVVGVHQTGTKSSFGLKLGSDATVTQVDSHATPIRRQGVCWYSWHVSEFAATYATTVPGTFALLLQTAYGASGHSGVTTMISGPAYAGMTHRPVLAFSFDDGYAEVFTRVYPLFQSLGLVGTVFAARDHVGAAGRMTWDNLRTLAAAGWSICVNATPDDTSMSTDAATAVAGVRIGQQLLVDNSVAINGSETIVCYPTNASTETVRAALARIGIKAGRTTNPHGATDVFGLGDQGLYLPSYSLAASSVEATVKARIDQAVLRGESQWLHVHQPVDSAPSGTQVLWSLLEAVASYAATYISSSQALNTNAADYVAMTGLRSAPPIV